MANCFSYIKHLRTSQTQFAESDHPRLNNFPAARALDIPVAQSCRQGCSRVMSPSFVPSVSIPGTLHLPRAFGPSFPHHDLVNGVRLNGSH